MEEMTWREQTGWTSKALELRSVERLGVIFLVTKGGDFSRSWSVRIKSIKMFRPNAFASRPFYFRSIVKNLPDIAIDLRHGQKDASSGEISLDRGFL